MFSTTLIHITAPSVVALGIVGLGVVIVSGCLWLISKAIG